MAGGAETGVEEVFAAQYGRIAGVLARVVRDRARAEELAVEVFVKFWRRAGVGDGNAEGWLYRTAVRMGLDELRRERRRRRYEALFGGGRASQTPEQIRLAGEEQERVRGVLAAMGRREAEMLVLRSEGWSYEELAAALGMKAGSVGTALSRAQKAFRKEYGKRYGEG
jgi:RNA polymerase sigma-70 factor (ECF subfamily)